MQSQSQSQSQYRPPPPPPLTQPLQEKSPTTTTTTTTESQNIPTNPFSQDGEACAQSLDYRDGYEGLFLAEDEEGTSLFRVEVVRFLRDRQTGRVRTGPRRRLGDAGSLAAALRDGSVASATGAYGRASNVQNNQGGDGDDARLTIITIPQQFSGAPLNITRPALQDLIRQLDIPTTFLPVLYAFGSVPRMSEAGLDCFTHVRDPVSDDDGSHSLTFLYRFKDRDQDHSGTWGEWKDRQIGVFHRYLSSTNENLFVVLQPHPDSLFDGGVEDDIQPNHEAMVSLMKNPVHLHQMLISLYFGGWREFLKEVADDFAKCSAQAVSQDIDKDYNLDFFFLQRWRNTIDNVVPIAATLDSIQRIIDGLQESQKAWIASGVGQQSPYFDVFIQMMSSQLLGLGQSARALEKRVANIAELLTNTIEGKNQFDAARLNRHMERLTVDTVDDSSSVRIITFLSLIYLPGSFVATLFGMNLFGFDQDTRQITIAKNFWLYVVIFLPLTAITFGGAQILSVRAKKVREERQRAFGVIPLH